ncbi:MAG: T9SS type A sorting domain-containing protein [Bacteroidota bacterium]
MLLKTSFVFSQCVPAGPSVSTNIANNTSIGSVGWSGILNGLSSDNAYISCGTLLGILGSAQTNYMYTDSYGFSVPSTATVCGIQVDIERNASGLLIGSSVKDKNVNLVKGGVVTGSNHALGSAWPGTDGMASYGNNADLWGTTWTPAEVNAGNFGVVVSAQLSAGLASLFLSANVDMVSITVYYTTKTLPIELVSFSGKVESQTIKLKWQTATEKNNHYFEVEKMNADYTWNTLDRIAGAGNSTQVMNYETYDYNLNDINYYRIKQVDHTNDFTYSPTISVDYNAKKQPVLIIYPIPVVQYLVIDIASKVDKIEIVSDDGCTIEHELIKDDHLKINTEGLSTGLYLIKVFTGNDIITKRFMKE